jgi:ATP-dependent Clp protease adaptor protein ClpS
METTILEPTVEKQLSAEIKEMVNPTKAILLYNDDINSFEHVIECLMLYCNHSIEQAEQIALIVHNRGKCDIKHGSYEKLKPVYEVLQEKHLSVKIE